jgi:hypothetical protein
MGTTIASKNAASKDQAESTLTVGTKHEASSEDEEDREDLETLLAAQEVCRHICKQTAKEGTSLVQGNNVFLRYAELVSAQLFKAEFGHEAGQ